MRYSTVLIAIATILSQASGQVTFSVSIGLAETYCTDPSDPDNCFNVSSGNDNLTYKPGIDGDFLVTYAVENNGAFTISQLSISDTKHGLVQPTIPVNIISGQDYYLTLRFDSLSTAELIDVTATLLIENSSGASAQRTADYTINVLGPEVEVGTAGKLAEDFCDDETDIATCYVISSSDFGDTIMIGGGQQLYMEYRVQNIGETDVKLHTFDDNWFGIVKNKETVNANPGSDIRFRSLLTAPTVPGIYNNLVTYTGEDVAGNLVVQQYNYVIKVLSPDAEIEVGLAIASEFCDDETNMATCPVLSTSTFGDTLRIGGAQEVYMELRLQNTGDVTIKSHTWDDDLFGIIETEKFTSSNPDSDIRFRYFMTSPSVPGIYSSLMTYVGKDDAGNQTTDSYTYVIEVLAPIVDFEAGGQIAGEICSDEEDLATCGVLPISFYGDTIRAAGAEMLYLEFRVQNPGEVSFSDNTIEDDYYGLLFENNGTTIRPDNDIRFRSLLEAPSLPGFYENTVSYIAFDEAGNQVDGSYTYFIDVINPDADIDVGGTVASSICTDENDLSTCGVLPDNSYGDTIYAGAGEKVYLEFRLQNMARPKLNNHSWDDSYFGLLVNENGANASEGSDIRFRNIVTAPDTSGLYENTVVYTGIDEAGNTIIRQDTYVLVVDCDVADFAPPIVHCRDTSIVVSPGENINLTISSLVISAFDGCGGSLSGSIDKSSFSCADVGVNEVTITVEDDSGNATTCISTVNVILDNTIPFTAGKDQESCSVDVILSAKVPNQGNGIWSIEDGQGGSFNNDKEPNTTFIGVRGESYTLRWTHMNNAGTCQFSDDVMVTILELPSVADAGIDQFICGDTTLLSAVSPTSGSGFWKIISGQEGELVDSSLQNSKLSGQRGNTYLLEWNVQNGSCETTKDTVQIEFLEIPTEAVAGQDIVICASEFSLSANSPDVGVGTWNVLEGVGGIISEPANPSSTFLGNQGELYKLEWSISNQACIVSRDTIEIEILQEPSASLAGNDQTVSNDSTTLEANTPDIGIGLWRFISGVGGLFEDYTSSTSIFSGLQGETYELEWSITNGTCLVQKDTVVINLEVLPPTEAEAGEDQLSCSTSIDLEANDPLIGTGEWSIVTGSGGSFENQNSHSTTFTGIQGKSYLIQWSIENDGLISTDQINVRITDSTEVINDNYISEWEEIVVIQGSNIIQIDAIFLSNFDKTIKAGAFVEFLDGFEILNGGTMEVLIESCND